MNNHRELSVDELDTVSGGDLGGLASIVQLESVRLEGVRNTTVSTPTASPGGLQAPNSRGLAALAKIEAAYAALK